MRIDVDGARRALRARLSAGLLLGAAAAMAGDAGLEQQLLGSWICTEGACPDEEIAFAIEQGVHTYNSWLHARPSALDGRWTLTDRTLAITCCAGIDYVFTIVAVSATTLTLRDEDSGEQADLARSAVAEPASAAPDE